MQLTKRRQRRQQARPIAKDSSSGTSALLSILAELSVSHCEEGSSGLPSLLVGVHQRSFATNTLLDG